MDEKRKVSLPQPASEDHATRVLKGMVDEINTSLGLPVRRESAAPALTEGAAPPALEEKVIAALRTVYDPEIPLNVYDLGLIYALTIDPTEAVHIKMTLTAPACPMADEIVASVKRKVETIPEVPRATVELVWDPPWTKDRLSEAAKLELGLL